MQVEGQGNPNELLLQWYKARTSPPSSQKYDTILKRENMFLCGQTAESVVCTCLSVCYFLNQYSQFFALDFCLFFPSFFICFFYKKREEEDEGVQAVTELLSGWLGGVFLFDSV